MEVGKRRLNMMRVFNADEGFDRKQDQLPKKFFKALGGSGPTAGLALDKDKIEPALDEYYRLAGWTPNGVPTEQTLADLGLAWTIQPGARPKLEEV